MKDLANFCWPLYFTPPRMIPLTHSFLKIKKNLPWDFFFIQPEMTDRAQEYQKIFLEPLVSLATGVALDTYKVSVVNEPDGRVDL